MLITRQTKSKSLHQLLVTVQQRVCLTLLAPSLNLNICIPIKHILNYHLSVPVCSVPMDVQTTMTNSL